MSRARRKVGDVVVAANGYSYTYEAGPGDVPVRTLTHWIVARKKYGRPPRDDEQVRFVDGNRKNLKPENVVYVSKSNPVMSLRRRRATLMDKISEYQAELAEVEKALKEAGVQL